MLHGAAQREVPALVALASADPAAFVLAYEAIDGRSLDRLDPGDLDDEVLAAIWSQVGLLRDRRVAHRDLRLANLFLANDGTIWIIDFGFSELSASDTLLAGDIAELLASTSLHVGVDRSVSAAIPTRPSRLGIKRHGSHQAAQAHRPAVS